MRGYHKRESFFFRKLKQLEQTNRGTPGVFLAFTKIQRRCFELELETALMCRRSKSQRPPRLPFCQKLAKTNVDFPHLFRNRQVKLSTYLYYLNDRRISSTVVSDIQPHDRTLKHYLCSEIESNYFYCFTLHKFYFQAYQGQ